MEMCKVNLGHTHSIKQVCHEVGSYKYSAMQKVKLKVGP